MTELENTKKSRENEVALIGAVMRDGKIYEQAREIVQSSDFGWECYAWAWEACEQLFSNGMSIDTITVGDELERKGKIEEFQINGTEQDVLWTGRLALSKIRETGDPRNFLSYAENVVDYSAKRSILECMKKGASEALNGRRSKDIISDLNQRLSTITIYGSQDEHTVPISVATSEAYDWTTRASKGEIVGVPTGFIDLDKLLGSMIAGNVYILAGRPKTGKTGFLVSVARNVAKSGKRVAMFSLEMSREQIAHRLISQEAEVDLHNIIHGSLGDRDWPKFTEGVETVSQLPIDINDLSNININQIRQTARKIKASHGLDLLIVDYIQLAGSDSTKRYGTRELEVSAISRGLKYLARELQIPILAAAQLSRAVEQRSEKKPILSDLRESGSLEQDAFAVMFIYRPDQYEADSDKHNITELILAAHRNGPTGNVSLVFRAAFAKFESAVMRTFRPNEQSWQKRSDIGDD